ncbi:MAG: nuclear transport factor 2 family protein [Alphaproteobacteria bacterium]|nr:nuclear transport factor 2 family protein [Alphaproteobacteria bacterium]
MKTKHDVLRANHEFYSAFRSGDYARMDALWAAKHKVSVYHPNWEGIEGREAVMASWFEVMVVAEPPMVTVRDESVIMTGQRAMVLCTECFESTRIVASNLFVLEDGEWRMTHHQATHLPYSVNSPPRTKN